jgi:hypothetical protein
MGRRCGDGDARFSTYLNGLASVMGRVSRVGPMRDYCTGLLLHAYPLNSGDFGLI